MDRVRPVGIISSALSAERFPVVREEDVATPFGPARIVHAEVAGRPVVGMLRFGRDIARAAHRINYRANLYALKRAGVERIISQNAIGSVNPSLRPGDIVIPHDFIDYTRTRPHTMFDGDDCWVRVDMTEPFCPTMRRVLADAARAAGGNVIPRGVFICVEGPRFETPQEIAMFRQWGADIVGTPLVPEVIFAREMAMCFASISPIIDYGTGLAPAVIHTGPGSMLEFYYGGGYHDIVERALVRAIEAMPVERDCPCARALEGAVRGELPAWWQELPR